MRILFIGDVVGRLGRQMIVDNLSVLKQEWAPQVTIINGENAASGRGITEKIYKELLKAGADVITLGNHAFDNRQIYDFIEEANNLVRPANYPLAPGKGVTYMNVNQYKLAIINLQGRTFMPPIDDPFSCLEQLLLEVKKETPHIFVDFHAEATSEKQALALAFDGQVSAICGTHTHVQTNDARILPNKTAYLTDVGMTGPVDSILGMQKEAVIQKFKTSLPHRFEVMTEGEGILNYAIIDLDDQTGQARNISVHHITDKGDSYGR